MTMADHIAVMNAGHIEQLADPTELYERPATTFVANFLGQSNLLKAQVTGPVGDGLVGATTHGVDIVIDAARLPAGLTDIWVGVRPEKLKLGSQGRNRVNGKVTDASFTGVATQYLVELPWGIEVTVVQQNDGSSRARVGENVTLSWEPGQEFILDQSQDDEAGTGIDDD